MHSSLGHERKNTYARAGQDQQGRINFVLQQDQQYSNRNGRGFHSGNCAFGHAETAGQQQPDRYRRKSLLNRRSPRPFLELFPALATTNASTAVGPKKAARTAIAPSIPPAHCPIDTIIIMLGPGAIWPTLYK